MNRTEFLKAVLDELQNVSSASELSELEAFHVIVDATLKVAAEMAREKSRKVPGTALASYQLDHFADALQSLLHSPEKKA